MVRLLLPGLLLALSFCLSTVQAQQDCITAEVLCDDGNVAFNPIGPGPIIDFANPNNDAGCLETDERHSAWYYFAFRTDMPPNSIISFIINPNGGVGEDYDFAIYGPNPDCNNLGSPLRCSYADEFCAFCPITGLGQGAQDDSETPSGDGFVAPMIVQPGQGFYLMVDNFLGTSNGFELSWGGSAAPFLNCVVDPTCTMNVTIEDVLEVCPGGAPVTLDVIVADNMGTISYVWTGPSNIIGFLDDVNVPNPTLTVPDSFSGQLTYTLAATDDICTETVPISITISSPAPPTITGTPIICDGDPATLDGGAGYSTYEWSTGATTQTISVTDVGIYSLTITEGGSCIAESSINVSSGNNPVVSLSGDFEHCLNEPTTVTASGTYVSLSWPDGSSGNSWTTTQVGDLSVRATSSSGCVQDYAFTIEGLATPVFQFDSPLTLNCYNETITLSATLEDPAADVLYTWTGPGIDAANQNSPAPTVSAAGLYTLQIADNTTACLSTLQELTVIEDFATPDLTVTQDQAFDCANPTILLRIPEPPTGITYTILWLFGTNEAGNSTSLLADEEGRYTVTVTNDQNGCTDSNTYELIYIDDAPSAIELAVIPQRCAGENDASIEVLSVADGIGPFTYQLDNGTVGTPTLFGELAPGTYTITAFDSRGCSISESVELVPTDNVLVVALPTPVVIELGNPLRLEADLITSGQGITDISWTSTTGLVCEVCTLIWEPASVLRGGIFTIFVTDTLGCTVSATTRVVVDKDYAIYIPNVFSPNGDGTNDRFLPLSDIELGRVVSLSIFDRWGNLVYSRTNLAPNQPGLGWDGMFNGQLANTGVYVYVTEVEFIDGKRTMYEGSVTLLR